MYALPSGERFSPPGPIELSNEGTTMKRLLILGAATALALPLTACNQTAPTPTASNHDVDMKAIQDGETQWVTDWNSKDAAKIVAHYTDNAVVMMPGEDAASGKDAITKSLGGMVTDPAFVLKFHADHVDVASAGDMAYTQGGYTVTYTDQQSRKVINDHGAYVTVYKKQADGSWKSISDIANSATPISPRPRP